MDQPLKLMCDQIMEWWYRNGEVSMPPFVSLALKLLQEDAADPRPMGVQQAEAERRTVGIAPGPVLEAVTDGVLADLKADAEIAADQQPTDHVENDFH
jgi:hypothetical protein